MATSLKLTKRGGKSHAEIAGAELGIVNVIRIDGTEHGISAINGNEYMWSATFKTWEVCGLKPRKWTVDGALKNWRTEVVPAVQTIQMVEEALDQELGQ